MKINDLFAASIVFSFLLTSCACRSTVLIGVCDKLAGKEDSEGALKHVLAVFGATLQSMHASPAITHHTRLALVCLLKHTCSDKAKVCNW